MLNVRLGYGAKQHLNSQYYPFQHATSKKRTLIRRRFNVLTSIQQPYNVILTSYTGCVYFETCVFVFSRLFHIEVLRKISRSIEICLCGNLFILRLTTNRELLSINTESGLEKILLKIKCIFFLLYKKCFFHFMMNINLTFWLKYHPKMFLSYSYF